MDLAVALKHWYRLLQTLRNNLALANATKTLILRIKGQRDDHIGIDVNVRSMQIMLSICQKHLIAPLGMFS